ncbi:hypothetical protein OSTOST_26090 [Ostertagia ostertagi]
MAAEIIGLKFEYTAFIAATRYQNNEVTQRRISHNPFAKGFRKDGRRQITDVKSALFSEPSPKRTSSEM